MQQSEPSLVADETREGASILRLACMLDQLPRISLIKTSASDSTMHLSVENAGLSGKDDFHPHHLLETVFNSSHHNGTAYRRSAA
jgi:hypothetical protein